MRRQQSRIFVYTPSDPAPEPGTNSHPPPSEWGDSLRDWLFSPLIAVCVWVLALGLIVPAGGIIALTLPEDYAQLILGCGLWLVLGLAIIHWWIPPANDSRAHSEGLAIAGWHVLLSAFAAGGVSWVMLFSGGVRPAFTLADFPPVIVMNALIVAWLGVLLTLLRGHRIGRAGRYAWTVSWVLLAWMSLWLVASHAGM